MAYKNIQCSTEVCKAWEKLLIRKKEKGQGLQSGVVGYKGIVHWLVWYPVIAQSFTARRAQEHNLSWFYCIEIIV